MNEQNATKVQTWTAEDTQKFMELVPLYGTEYRQFLRHFPGLTFDQIKEKYQSFCSSQADPTAGGAEQH